jgi:hypothetical protein
MKYELGEQVKVFATGQIGEVKMFREENLLLQQ